MSLWSFKTLEEDEAVVVPEIWILTSKIFYLTEKPNEKVVLQIIGLEDFRSLGTLIDLTNVAKIEHKT